MDNKFYAILDQDNLVINHIALPVDADISNIISNCYSERYSIMEYSGAPLSEDKSITNTPALVGLYYNPTLNAFIARKPGDDYILDEETYQWVSVPTENP